MITPRWGGTRCQADRDRRRARLPRRRARPCEVTGVVEIGGPDILSYGDMMRTYARLRGLRRLMIPVPVLTPRLSSYWVNLISPVPAAIARPLIEGLRNEVVVHDPEPAAAFDLHRVPTSRRSGGRSIGRPPRRRVHLVRRACGSDRRACRRSLPRGMIVERRGGSSRGAAGAGLRRSRASRRRAGWPYANALWRIRGLVDRLVGGVGMASDAATPTIPGRRRARLLAGEELRRPTLLRCGRR